jgi:hypothetical protein
MHTIIQQGRSTLLTNQARLAIRIGRALPLAVKAPATRWCKQSLTRDVLRRLEYRQQQAIRGESKSRDTDNVGQATFRQRNQSTTRRDQLSEADFLLLASYPVNYRVLA